MTEDTTSRANAFARPVAPMIGCDDLREWLISQGFKCSIDHLGHQHNACNWYAYRKSSFEARECECNGGKSMQVVAKPFRLVLEGAKDHTSVELEVTGEAGGIWYKLSAYSLSQEEIRDRLGDIEQSLIAAWNALIPTEHSASRKKNKIITK